MYVWTRPEKNAIRPLPYTVHDISEKAQIFLPAYNI